jgi:hypothetical protein
LRESWKRRSTGLPVVSIDLRSFHSSVRRRRICFEVGYGTCLTYSVCNNLVHFLAVFNP